MTNENILGFFLQITNEKYITIFFNFFTNCASEKKVFMNSSISPSKQLSSIVHHNLFYTLTIELTKRNHRPSRFRDFDVGNQSHKFLYIYSETVHLLNVYQVLQNPLFYYILYDDKNLNKKRYKINHVCQL